MLITFTLEIHYVQFPVLNISKERAYWQQQIYSTEPSNNCATLHNILDIWWTSASPLKCIVCCISESCFASSDSVNHWLLDVCQSDGLVAFIHGSSNVHSHFTITVMKGYTQLLLVFVLHICCYECSFPIYVYNWQLYALHF